MAHRTRDEIFASMLQSAASNKVGTRFTRMMYDSFLSYTQILQHLKELIKGGLLVNEPDITRYKITDRGRAFLDLIERMNSLLRDIA